MRDTILSEARWWTSTAGDFRVAKRVKALGAGQNVTVGARGGAVTGITGRERVNVSGARTDYARNYSGGVVTLSKSGFGLDLQNVGIVSYTG